MKVFQQVKVFVFVMFASIGVNAKDIAIVVFDGVLTSDVTAPMEVFGAASKKSWFADYTVSLVSATKEKQITTEEGLHLVAHKTIYDVAEYDVVLAPSAYNMRPWVSNDDLIAFLQKHSKQSTWMASNCSGALLLAEAGVLDGKQATTWAGGEKSFSRKYPKVDVVFDKNVVLDEGVISSNGGAVSYQAALLLLEKLTDKKFSDEIAEAIQFSRLKTAF